MAADLLTFRVLILEGYYGYCAMCRTCGEKRGWDRRREAEQGALEARVTIDRIEEYTPGEPGTCACAIAPTTGPQEPQSEPAAKQSGRRARKTNTADEAPRDGRTG